MYIKYRPALVLTGTSIPLYLTLLDLSISPSILWMTRNKSSRTRKETKANILSKTKNKTQLTKWVCFPPHDLCCIMQISTCACFSLFRLVHTCDISRSRSTGTICWCSALLISTTVVHSQNMTGYIFWTELNFLHSLLVHACTSAHACTYMLVLICLCLYLYLYLYVCTYSLCVLVLVLVLICLCLCLHLYLFFVCVCACTCACAGTYMLVLVLVLVLCVCLYLCLCLHLYLCLHHTCGPAHQQLSSQHNPKM